MEIHLYVAMVLKMLNITLLDPVPQPVSACYCQNQHNFIIIKLINYRVLYT